MGDSVVDFLMTPKHPKLIILTGRPAAGKSTIGKRLSRDLKLPIISKDGIREVLLDWLGCKDRPWARLLGKAAIDLMFYFARAELDVGNSIILDNAFDPILSGPRFRALKADYNAESIQVVCNSDSETLFERFKGRVESGNRHPGHREEDAFNHIWKLLSKEESPVLDIGGEVIEMDTTDFEKVDYQAILHQVRIFMER
jgi:predicted kinase